MNIYELAIFNLALLLPQIYSFSHFFLTSLQVDGGSPRRAGGLGEKRPLCTAFGPGSPGGSSESRDLRHGAIPGATPAAKRQGDRTRFTEPYRT